MKFEIIKKALVLASIMLLGTILTACGGGGDGSTSTGSGNSGGNSTVTISGTAATGAAIVGTVNIYGSNGGEILNVQIDAVGNFSVDVSGLTAPYYLSAVPDNNSLPTQYSFANTAGTTNITPLTTLILFYANAGQNPAALVNSWPNDAQAILASALNSQEMINANLVGQFPLQNIDFTTFDFLTSVFSIGGAFDQILDQILVNITNNTALMTISGKPTFIFDSTIDTSAINIGGSDNGNATGVIGNFGNLTLSGPDASIIAGTFQAVELEVFPSETVPGALSIAWNSSQIGYGVSMGVTDDDRADAFAIVFSTGNAQTEFKVYHYHVNCIFGDTAGDCSGVSINRANKQIIIENLVVPPFAPDQDIRAASGPMTISGTLRWE